MAGSAASKMLTATVHLFSSSTAAALTHRRPMTCSPGARLVPQPPDMIRWVTSEGGFVHPELKLADNTAHGLGVVAVDEIPEGSELVALLSHIPLRLETDDNDGCSTRRSTATAAAHPTAPLPPPTTKTPIPLPPTTAAATAMKWRRWRTAERRRCLSHLRPDPGMKARIALETRSVSILQAAEGEEDYIGRIVEFFEGTDNQLYFTLQWFFRCKDT